MPSTKWLIVLLLAGAYGSAENPGQDDQVAHSAMAASMGSKPAVSEVSAESCFLERSVTDLHLDKNRGLMMDDQMPFTGVALQHYPGGKLQSKTTYDQGKKHGHRQHWFADGSISFEAHYRSGRLHGTSQSWWRNGQLRSESHHVNGIAEGTQRQWYASGALFKKLNLVDGKEFGMQQAFRENGAVYANYDVRDGRIYGLKRANLCFSLEDGAIAYE